MPLCLQMPYLHSRLSTLPGKTLWIGMPLENVPTSALWQPVNLPFSPEETQACARQLRELGPVALENLRHVISRQRQTEAALFADEMACRADFMAQSRANAEKAWQNLLAEAQQILLWCFLQEGLLGEISALASFCEDAEQQLGDLFQEGQKASSQKEGILPMDESLLPPWRACVANAAFFIPDDAHIMALGAMRDDLSEILDFSFDQALSDQYACKIYSAVAPLWQALGHSRPTVLPHGESGARLGRHYAQARTWLLAPEK